MSLLVVVAVVAAAAAAGAGCWLRDKERVNSTVREAATETDSGFLSVCLLACSSLCLLPTSVSVACTMCDPQPSAAADVWGEGKRERDVMQVCDGNKQAKAGQLVSSGSSKPAETRGECE